MKLSFLYILIFIVIFSILNSLNSNRKAPYHVYLPAKLPVNKQFNIRLSKLVLLSGRKINVDYHWFAKNHEYKGFLKQIINKPIITNSGEIIFTDKIEYRPELAYVSLLFYISKTGFFKDKIESFKTEKIPVKNLNIKFADIERFNTYFLFENNQKNSIKHVQNLNKKSKQKFSYVITIGYLICVIILFILFLFNKKIRFNELKINLFVLFSFIFLFLEKYFNIFEKSTNYFRILAMKYNLYYIRKTPQKIFVSACICIFLFLCKYLYKKFLVKKYSFSKILILFLTFILIFLKLLNALSYHYFDSILTKTHERPYLLYIGELFILCAIVVLYFIDIIHVNKDKTIE